MDEAGITMEIWFGCRAELAMGRAAMGDEGCKGNVFWRFDVCPWGRLRG